MQSSELDNLIKAQNDLDMYVSLVSGGLEYKDRKRYRRLLKRVKKAYKIWFKRMRKEF